MAYRYKIKDIAMLFVDYIYHRKSYNKAFERRSKTFNLCL